jgi:hypothetical protein
VALTLTGASGLTIAAPGGPSPPRAPAPRFGPKLPDDWR